VSARGAVAACIAAVVVAAAACGAPAPEWTTQPVPADPTAVTSAITPRPVPSLPTTVDGQPVMTVSQLLTARADGAAKRGPYALRGYWSVPDYPFSCPAPMAEPGVLELYCGGMRFGITERDELALTIVRSANETSAHGPSGPVLVPYVSDEQYRQLLLSPVGDQPHAPVPIVVTGHFDDPRAALCQPEARQACIDRFVVDTIVMFDPASVGDPTPAPTGTPFPFDSPPAAPFGVGRCRAGETDPLPLFSFVGWMPGDQLQSGMGVDYSGVTLFVAITLAAVPLGTWSDASPRWRPMGRMICVGREGEPGGVQFDYVPGSSYRQFEDGSTAPPLP
jgi:hypothetical protein